jgi:hypothetical protein
MGIESIAIGYQAGALLLGCGYRSISIGKEARTSNINTITIGNVAYSTGIFAVTIGDFARVSVPSGISIGEFTRIMAGDESIAIGKCACVNNVAHRCAIAIGSCVCSTRANVLTTCE